MVLFERHSSPKIWFLSFMVHILCYLIRILNTLQRYVLHLLEVLRYINSASLRSFVSSLFIIYLKMDFSNYFRGMFDYKSATKMIYFNYNTLSVWCFSGKINLNLLLYNCGIDTLKTSWLPNSIMGKRLVKCEIIL